MYRPPLMLLVIAATLSACGAGGPASAPEAAQAMAATMHKQASQVTASTVTVAAYRNNFTIINLDGVVTLVNKVDGLTSAYTNVTTIKFADRETSLDLNGTEAQVYRLYQAAFNRAPDAAGLGFWIQVVRDGKTLTDVASGFQDSDEFRTLYGNADNRAFVTKVYQNVLHRDPEDGGLNWWVGVLDNGASRANAMTGFSESNENKANLHAAMVNGIDSIPFYKPAGTPLVPKSSSYANMKQAGFAMQNLAGAWQGDATAFGDFFSDGTLSIVSHTLEYDGRDINTSNKFGHIKFFQQVNGKWLDNTSKLLSNNVGCLHPRKAVVADYNGDGKADVFFACHGFDAVPFPGEKQVFLMSQANGTYSNSKTAFDCFCHGASAAILNRTGYADILIADQTVEKKPYFMINNADGTFTKDTSRLPDMTHKQIWSAELIDVNADGKFDAFLAGGDPRGDGYQIAPTIFVNDGVNMFNASKIEIPLAAVAFNDGVTLDIVFDNNMVYLLRTNYASVSVQKTDLSTMTTKELYRHTGMYVNGAWFPWMNIQGDFLEAYSVPGIRIPKS